MIDFITLMWKPLVACLVLTGIHAYLGLHVVERKVIFVDLALAQIAALGSVLAVLFEHALHGQHTYWFSLMATFVGAFIFAMTRSRKEKVPHEAIIGIVYAVSAALAFLILSGHAEGDEHIRHIFIGNVLLISGEELMKIFILYSMVGAVHFIYRKKLILISTDPEKAFQKKMNVKAWDLFFYITFGIVVTSSVEIVGVLLVFSFLIIPSVVAMLYSDGIAKRLVIGWIFGTIASSLGIFLSYHYDLPTGSAIVCTFGGLLIILALLKQITKENR